jgi:putative peptide zinc metalloprotease protein
MHDPLVSGAWHRVADLRPQLAPDAGLARQRARERIWHLLTDPGSGRQVRLNAPAWAFAGRCDGTRSVDEIWRLLVLRMGDAAPSQDDVLRLVAQLHAQGLLLFDRAPDLTALFVARQAEARRRERAWINPLALRLRLLDPGMALERLAPRLAGLFSLPALAVWGLCVAIGALLCGMHFAALKAEAARLIDTPRALWLLWLCYPPIKALHEFAHALAVRHFGGQVREAGITLLFFTPAPYVDASAASAFPDRRERMVVSAAGIAAELFVAACAAMLWAALMPGLLRDAALTLLLIGAVSTVAVNANPLMRFDGYHLACDALDLPNLAMRSAAWWGAQWRRALAGGAAPAAALLARGELKWLVMYAPAALAWRVGLAVTLVLWVGAKSALLGGLLGAALLAWALWRGLAALCGAASAAPQSARRRTRLAAGMAGAAAAVLLFAVPVPSTVVAQGVVWPPEDAQVRAQTAGFIDTVAARHGQAVTPGAVLMTLREDSLAAERERLQSQEAGHRTRQYEALLRDPARAVAAAQDIERAEAELARVEAQIALLEVRGGAAGRLVLPREADLQGSYAARGAMLGYILGPQAANVRAVLAEGDALRVRERARGVEVRAVEARLAALPARLAREAPGAVRQLPSAALGERAGGGFAVDPADRDGLRTLEPVFLVDVQVPDLSNERIGARVWVRFDLGLEPIGTQTLRHARRLLLRHFNPGGHDAGAGA